MRVVYIAGPFTGQTAWEVEQNVRRAEEVGLDVANLGAMPLIPHCNSRFFHGQINETFWYEGTLELLKRCDAMLVTGVWGSSVGVMAELDLAENLGIPCFHTLAQLQVFLQS